MRTSTLELKRAGGIATITLTGRGGGKWVDGVLAQDLCSVSEEIAADEDVAVVLLKASGRHFCQGGSSNGLDWAGAVASIPQPLIAAIQGDATDEGAELALVADIRLCSRNARFRFAYLEEERLPSSGASQRLPRTVGRMRALELLLSGRWVSAAEAGRIGLVTEVLPADGLARQARAVARNLAKRGPTALRYAKEAVHAGLDMTLSQGIRLEQDLYVLLQTTEDRAEGVRSFLDKRPPAYRGR